MYGGNYDRDTYDFVDRVERIDLLAPQEGFKVINIENQYLLDCLRNTVAFPCNDLIGIIGQQNNHLIWYDPKSNSLEQSKVEVLEGECFEHGESGYFEGDLIYLTGYYHMYVFDKKD